MPYCDLAQECIDTLTATGAVATRESVKGCVVDAAFGGSNDVNSVYR